MKTMVTNRGYSLVEIMMVVSVLGVVMLLGSTLVVQIQNSWMANSARYEIQRDARQSLDIIDRMLRQGVNSSVVIDSPAGQGVFSRITFNTVNGSTMQFYQQNNQLIMANGAQKSILSQNLYYLTFTFTNSNSPNLVSVALAMSKKIYKGQQQILEISIRSVRLMN